MFFSFKKTVPTDPPDINLLHLPCEGVETPRLILTCIVADFHSEQIAINWYINGNFQSVEKSSPIPNGKGGKEKAFTIISRLETSMDEWKKGSMYSCAVKHGSTTTNKTVSLCTACSSIEPTIHLQKPTFEAIFKGERISADCVVVALKDSTVSWVVDGREQDSTSVGNTLNRNNTQNITRRLTVSAAQWKSYSKVSCKVTHPCFTKEASITKETGPSKTPVLELLRPSEDQLGADSAELTCIISGFFPSDIYVKWQKGDKEIGPDNYKNNPVAPENGGVSYSMVSRLTISKNEWTTRNTYSCKAAHGTKWFEAKTPDNLFGPSKNPVLELLRPSEDQLGADSAELTCIISGFFPSDIYVKWQKGDKEIGPDNYKNNPVAPENGGVSYSMVSRLTISKNEWTTRNTYSCKAAHGTKWFEAKTPDNLFEIIEEKDFHDDNVDYFVPEDDMQGVWTTACTFIILFLLSFLYSSFVTVVKVRK
ncbi:UNVERIFIED_CONTAM: hypothetical protein FKN15_060622 [Acipenser sinensis]